MRADFPVVLDACSLAPPNLCDLLLRLAETPRLYGPHWSSEILDEVHRTQINKLGFPRHLADSWRTEVERFFPESMVTGHEPLIEILTNDPKDRHVLAAAIRAHAEVIVTFNLRHFPSESLQAWGITARHPSNFLINLYSIDPAVVVAAINAIANDRNRTPQEYLAQIGKLVLDFVQKIASDLKWEI